MVRWAQAQRGAVLARQESLELKDAHFLNLVRCGVNLAPCAGAEQGAEQGAAPVRDEWCSLCRLPFSVPYPERM